MGWQTPLAGIGAALQAFGGARQQQISEEKARAEERERQALQAALQREQMAMTAAHYQTLREQGERGYALEEARHRDSQFTTGLDVAGRLHGRDISPETAAAFPPHIAQFLGPREIARLPEGDDEVQAMMSGQPAPPPSRRFIDTRDPEAVARQAALQFTLETAPEKHAWERADQARKPELDRRAAEKHAAEVAALQAGAQRDLDYGKYLRTGGAGSRTDPETVKERSLVLGAVKEFYDIQNEKTSNPMAMADDNYVENTTIATLKGRAGKILMMYAPEVYNAFADTVGMPQISVDAPAVAPPLDGGLVQPGVDLGPVGRAGGSSVGAPAARPSANAGAVAAAALQASRPQTPQKKKKDGT